MLIEKCLEQFWENDLILIPIIVINSYHTKILKKELKNKITKKQWVKSLFFPYM